MVVSSKVKLYHKNLVAFYLFMFPCLITPFTDIVSSLTVWLFAHLWNARVES